VPRNLILQGATPVAIPYLALLLQREAVAAGHTAIPQVPELITEETAVLAVAVRVAIRLAQMEQAARVTLQAHRHPKVTTAELHIY
jgi:hypothetical protein